MKNGLAAAVVITVAAGLLIAFWRLYDAKLYDVVPFGIWIVCVVLAIAASTAAAVMWVSLLVHTVSKKRVSPHLIFGIVCAVLAVAAAVYGICSDTMLSGVALCFLTPIFAALAAIDTAVYFVLKKIKSRT